MTLFYLTIAMLLALTAPGAISPSSSYELGIESEPGPGCRAAKPRELVNRRADAEGKASGWSLRGNYICQRRIFDYGERDSYFDFVSNHAESQIARYGETVSQASELFPDRPWFVQVLADQQDVSTHVHQVSRLELSRRLGVGRVSRLARPNQEDYLLLTVVVRRVSDPQLLMQFDIRAFKGGKLQGPVL